MKKSFGGFHRSRGLPLFNQHKMLPILLMGFFSGIPLGLVGSTLQAWMASREIDLTIIGLFSLVGLPYTLKFFWAPLMDFYSPPFLSRRRGWIFISQLCLFLLISLMAFCDPKQNPNLMAALAFAVAFSSASQDIVIDAYKTEILSENEFGTGAAVSNLGYRLAMLCSGALALILADHLPWRTVYLMMALIFPFATLVTLLVPEPTSKPRISQTAKAIIIEPFLEFFRRRGSWEIFSFVILYKLDVVVALALMTPFMLQLGFSKTDIGAVTKGFGLVATLAGTFVGGAWLAKIGIRRSLWIFGILQGISGACFFLLAKLGHHYPMMVATITAENFFSGMGNAAYSAFIMSLCNPQFTATQFALLTSLMALSRVIAGTPTGWMAKALGWEMYFLVAMCLSIPSLLLLTRYQRWVKRGR